MESGELLIDRRAAAVLVGRTPEAIFHWVTRGYIVPVTVKGKLWFWPSEVLACAAKRPKSRQVNRVEHEPTEADLDAMIEERRPTMPPRTKRRK